MRKWFLSEYSNSLKMVSSPSSCVCWRSIRLIDVSDSRGTFSASIDGLGRIGTGCCSIGFKSSGNSSCAITSRMGLPSKWGRESDSRDSVSLPSSCSSCDGIWFWSHSALSLSSLNGDGVRRWLISSMGWSSEWYFGRVHYISLITIYLNISCLHQCREKSESKLHVCVNHNCESSECASSSNCSWSSAFTRQFEWNEFCTNKTSSSVKSLPVSKRISIRTRWKRSAEYSCVACWSKCSHVPGPSSFAECRVDQHKWDY